LKDWSDSLKENPIPWLLERDNPSVRYFTLTEILERPGEDPEVIEAKEAIMASGPVEGILAAQYPEGFWVKPGVGYSPRYRATVWQIILLAELGASLTEQIEKGCRYVLEHSFLPELGLFLAHKGPSGAFLCLNGNLICAFSRLGYREEPRVRKAAERTAEVILRRGFGCRYNAIEKKRVPWPPCVWGAVKVLSAFSKILADERSHTIEAAIERGVDFLLSYDLIKGDYPGVRGRSRLWLKFGFPLGYTSDLLEAVTALAELGVADPNINEAVEFVISKQGGYGRWLLERNLGGKMWVRFEEKGKPSKWVTLRALRAIKKAAECVVS